MSFQEGTLSPEVTLTHAETGVEAVFRLPALAIRKAGRLQLLCDVSGKPHECGDPVVVPLLDTLTRAAYFWWAVVAETPEGKPLRLDPLVLINGSEVVCVQSHQGDPGLTPVVNCSYHGPAADRWKVEARHGDLSVSTTFVPEP